MTTTTPAPTTPAAPTAAGERIQTIDILRGFALLGILLVNMELFNSAFVAKIMGSYEEQSLLDQLARWFVAFFAAGKFYTIFAFLFGLGMILQMARAQARGTRFVPLYMRRMLVLLAFGLIHAYLFWIGDILILYAVLGMILLLFRKTHPRRVLIWVLIFLVVPVVVNAGLWGLIEWSRSSPEGAAIMDQMFAEQAQMYKALAVQTDQVYATGNFVEITRQRAADMVIVFSTWPFMAFNVFAAMLLGVYAGKRHIFADIPGHLPFIRKVLVWGLVIGVAGNLLYVAAGEFSRRDIPTGLNFVATLGQTFGAPALSLFYMAGITLLAEDPRRRARMAPLAAAGQMALTNYLLQTLICTTLFYGYGFGLYGQIGAFGGILLTLAIYALQLAFSVWWLRRFRFGPMEWLWRSLTYLRRQPMRRA
jgi:uncharacterized protein